MKKITLFFCCVLLFICNCMFGYIHFHSGQYEVVDYAINDEVRIDYNEYVDTHVEFQDGAVIDGPVRVYARGKLTSTGGVFNSTLTCHTYSEVYFIDGHVDQHFSASYKSTAVISGGTFRLGVSAAHEASVTINGGTIENYLYSESENEMYLNGGTINGQVRAYYSGHIVCSGGNIQGTVLAGRNFGDYYDDSVITFVGSDFKINDIAVAPGRYFRSDFADGILTGILQNGDVLDTDFVISSDSSIVLIPEPATVSLLAVGGLALLRRRK